MSKNNNLKGKNQYHNWSKNLLSDESSIKIPKMSRENGPVKEISIDAILMKDGKYLPAFAKGSNAYWRNTDKSLA